MTYALRDDQDLSEAVRDVSRLTLFRLSAAAWLRALRNRRAAYHIADLPDSLLCDMGLRRDDVEQALNVSWREDPTVRLALCARYRRPGR